MTKERKKKRKKNKRENLIKNRSYSILDFLLFKTEESEGERKRASCVEDCMS